MNASKGHHLWTLIRIIHDCGGTPCKRLEQFWLKIGLQFSLYHRHVWSYLVRSFLQYQGPERCLRGEKAAVARVCVEKFSPEHTPPYLDTNKRRTIVTTFLQHSKGLQADATRVIPSSDTRDDACLHRNFPPLLVFCLSPTMV